MIDLRDQIRSYAELLDAAAPNVDELALPTDPAHGGDAPVRIARWRPAVLAAAGVAAALVIAIGGIAIFAGGSEDAAGTSTVVTTPTATSQVTPTTGAIVDVEFILTGPDALAPRTEDGGSWDFPFSGPGAVVFHDGRFHMFRNGRAEDEPGAVGYLVSDDAVTWSDPIGAPLFDAAALPYGSGKAAVRSALVTGDGTWVLYLDIELGDGSEGEAPSPMVVGRATAPAPTGPWAFDASPALTVGATGSFADAGVGSPSVIPFEDGFVMFFVGRTSAGQASIGRAISLDGVRWGIEDADPVLIATDDWERGSLSTVDAVFDDGSWVLLYAGETMSRRGIAISDDGTDFEKLPENPMLDTTDVPRGGIFDTTLLRHEGEWLLFVENGGARSNTDISLLVYDGALRPR
ncbi:MAG: hypothetical protein ACE5GC_09500 [Acidimicrobiia bacterium]